MKTQFDTKKVILINPRTVIPMPHTIKNHELAERGLEISQIMDACMMFHDRSLEAGEAIIREANRLLKNGCLTTKTPKTNYPNLFDYGK